MPFCPVRAFTKLSGREGARPRGSFPVTTPGVCRCPLLKTTLPVRTRRPEGPSKPLRRSASGPDSPHARRARVWLPHVGCATRGARSILAPASRRYPAPDLSYGSRRGAGCGREAGWRERPGRRAASGRTMWRRRRRLMGARHHGGAQ